MTKPSLCCTNGYIEKKQFHEKPASDTLNISSAHELGFIANESLSLLLYRWMMCRGTQERWQWWLWCDELFRCCFGERYRISKSVSSQLTFTVVQLRAEQISDVCREWVHERYLKWTMGTGVLSKSPPLSKCIILLLLRMIPSSRQTETPQFYGSIPYFPD